MGVIYSAGYYLDIITDSNTMGCGMAVREVVHNLRFNGKDLATEIDKLMDIAMGYNRKWDPQSRRRTRFQNRDHQRRAIMQS
jgi:hypothetical protein